MELTCFRSIVSWAARSEIRDKIDDYAYDLLVGLQLEI
jgi:hypothetical protein